MAPLQPLGPPSRQPALLLYSHCRISRHPSPDLVRQGHRWTAWSLLRSEIGEELERRKQAVNSAFNRHPACDPEYLKTRNLIYKRFTYSAWKYTSHLPSHLTRYGRSAGNGPTAPNARFENICNPKKRFKGDDQASRLPSGTEIGSKLEAATTKVPEGEIDPITNRRVPRSSSAVASDEPTTISVKTFEGHDSQIKQCGPSNDDTSSHVSPITNAPSVLRKAGRGSETFATAEQHHNRHEEMVGAPSTDRNQRRLSSKGARLVANASFHNLKRSPGTIEPASSNRRPLDYRFERESKQDLDLLRARDRGTSLSGVKKKLDKRPTRSDLEREFESNLSGVDQVRKPTGPVFTEVRGGQETENLANSNEAKADRVPSSQKPSPQKLTGNYVRDFPEEFQTKWTTVKDSDYLLPGSVECQVRSSAATPSSDYENIGARARQAERRCVEGSHVNDGIPEPHDIARMETSLDRRENLDKIQKQLDSSVGTTDNVQDASALHGPDTSERRLPQGRDHTEKKLIRELRNIYEDEYGTIDIAHRQGPFRKESIVSAVAGANSRGQEVLSGAIKQQPGHNTTASRSPKESGNASPNIRQDSAQYKILAYDADSDSIKITDWASAVYDKDEPQTPAKVIAQLSYPAMFIGHFESLREEGFEIVSGVNDVLVFRKVPLTRNQNPTLYKILVYDADSDSVATARWVSTVQDNDSPRTPAQIMPELANPSKFLKYFEALRRENFDLISGVDDVIIFRKMRSVSGNSFDISSEFEPSQSLPPRDPIPPPPPKARINPIDGTIAHPIPPVVTGNYASPTGFVNHDLPPWFIPRERLPPPPPPPEPDPSKKKSKTRRFVIGAGWVALCSYAVGWFAENWNDM